MWFLDFVEFLTGLAVKSAVKINIYVWHHYSVLHEKLSWIMWTSEKHLKNKKIHLQALTFWSPNIVNDVAYFCANHAKRLLRLVYTFKKLLKVEDGTIAR